MSEKEKEIMRTIAMAIPNMTEFQKGHLLGVAEAMADQHRSEECRKSGSSI